MRQRHWAIHSQTPGSEEEAQWCEKLEMSLPKPHFREEWLSHKPFPLAYQAQLMSEEMQQRQHRRKGWSCTLQSSVLGIGPSMLHAFVHTVLKISLWEALSLDGGKRSNAQEIKTFYQRQKWEQDASPKPRQHACPAQRLMSWVCGAPALLLLPESLATMQDTHFLLPSLTVLWEAKNNLPLRGH